MVMMGSMRVKADLKSTPDAASMTKGRSMPIGDLAARFGLATHVLRHWEDMGLLRPARDAAGRRHYSETDAQRVAAILLARQAGFSLTDIGALILTPAGSRRREALRTHRDALAARIRDLQAAYALVDHAVGCTADDISTCAHFQQALATTTAANPHMPQ